jgi:hypothetical protein
VALVPVLGERATRLDAAVVARPSAS